MRVSEVYELFSSRPDLLEKYLTPEQIASARDYQSKIASMQSEITQASQKLGILPEYLSTDT